MIAMDRKHGENDVSMMNASYYSTRQAED